MRWHYCNSQKYVNYAIRVQFWQKLSIFDFEIAQNIFIYKDHTHLNRKAFAQKPYSFLHDTLFKSGA